MGDVISVIVGIINVIISTINDNITFIISTIVGINYVDTVEFDINTFGGEDDWGLEESAPFFELGFGFYLVAGVHFVEGYNIVDRVHG